MNPLLQTHGLYEEWSSIERGDPMAGSLNGKAPNPKTLDGHNQESGHCPHPLLKFILLKEMGEQERKRLDLQEFDPLSPGNISPSLPYSHLCFGDHRSI